MGVRQAARYGDAVTVVFAALAALWCLYLNSLLAPAAYERAFVNLWFDSDIGRVAGNMTIASEGHGGAFKHPLFAILILPPTRLLMALGLAREAALAAMLALNAALFVWLLDRLLHRTGLKAADRALLLLLCLGSSGFMFWFCVPETFPFGATSLMAALLLTAGGAAARPRHWAGATFLALSMTITNLLVVAAGALTLLWARRAAITGRAALLRLLRPVILGGASGLAGVVILALVQDRIFGQAGLFFNVEALAGERQFIGLEGASSTPARLQTLLLQVMVAGDPVLPGPVGVESGGEASGGLVADGRWPAGPAGLAALAGWGLILGLAVRGARGVGATTDAGQVTGAAGLFVALNLLLHLVYGASVFLYLAHFTGPVLLLAGLALRCGSIGRGGSIGRAGAAVRALVLGTALLAAAANFGTFNAANARAQQIYATLTPG